ncbi:twitching motility protein PilT [Phototrophicus methaneseepsis]|uniref:Twitching motility protein PilT n=1 Tax=Phototrophicus methaneseepsis TaxID=2710758 RepID=A0A7S8E7T6_9CHLR|nr:Mut7-C RNAse domain-containing protein [Phototrophicus methaneseepsis]QPC81878.1 twitching motility protein PilT [Phototrophicus methaneseepsis]
MARATFIFEGAITYFLPQKQKHQPIEHSFDWRASVKDMIESLGPPHTEVDLIMMNGQSVGFEAIVEDGAHIEVYSDASAVNITDKIQLRPPYPGTPRFVLDTHLGRLASYLRMLGFDTLYNNAYPDDELARISSEETRIVLTRDIGVLKRGIVTYGYYVRNTQPRQRILEINERYGLAAYAQPFLRCMKCNGLLKAVDKADVVEQLPPQVAAEFDTFVQCTSCGQIYWRGSHYTRMEALLHDVIDPH